MEGWRFRAWGAFCVLALVAFSSGSVWAQDPAQQQYGAPESSPRKVSREPNPEIHSLEARVEEQDAALETRVGEISAIGAELESAQARVNGAEARTRDLEKQARGIERDLAERRQAYSRTRTQYVEQLRAAYKDGGGGLASLLNALFDSSSGFEGVTNSQVAEVLFEGRESLRAYEETNQILRNTSRQVSQKHRDYEAALQEESQKARELRLREEELERVIDRISGDSAEHRTGCKNCRRPRESAF